MTVERPPMVVAVPPFVAASFYHAYAVYNEFLCERARDEGNLKRAQRWEHLTFYLLQKAREASEEARRWDRGERRLLCLPTALVDKRYAMHFRAAEPDWFDQLVDWALRPEPCDG